MPVTTTDATTFDELLAEGDAVPVEGWDFSWFAGRATEERPSWGYAALIGDRMATASAALDIQTGGGEVTAGIPRPPAVLRATESWPPNLEIARRNLRPLGGSVVEVADDAPLPFGDESFDLVVSRHPTVVQWDEIARVLRPGGTYLAQLIGDRTNRELSEYFLGPLDAQVADRATETRDRLAAAGLLPIDVRHEALRLEFSDVAAVVVFLRKVIWTVPGFSVDRFRDRLAAMHDEIQATGPFVSYAHRVLVDARKPAAG